jgi:hypothetical protein
MATTEKLDPLPTGFSISLSSSQVVRRARILCRRAHTVTFKFLEFFEIGEVYLPMQIGQCDTAPQKIGIAVNI